LSFKSSIQSNSHPEDAIWIFFHVPPMEKLEITIHLSFPSLLTTFYFIEIAAILFVTRRILFCDIHFLTQYFAISMDHFLVVFQSFVSAKKRD